MPAPPAAPATREMTFVARLQPRVHHIEVRARPEQRPCVADHWQQRHPDHPAWPEGGRRADGEPHANADRGDPEAATGLLREPTAELPLALAQRERDRG